MKRRFGLLMTVNVIKDRDYRGSQFAYCLSNDRPTPDEFEEACAGYYHFTHVGHMEMLQPMDHGFVFWTFDALTEPLEIDLDGDSRKQFYSFRISSPGPLRELWSQGVLVDLHATEDL